ncbi:30S ribosomal protein S8 [Candidatus Uhrbacteria bacterium]|nr:30S ribosomal protein S8 [Candidatus Uhrbacteria bacterium]
MTDPIADMLTRIRNAALIRQRRVLVPYSRMKLTIAEILSREGWAGAVTRTQEPDMIAIELLYDGQGKSVLTHLKRLSTPGRRVYVKRSAVPNVLNRFGLAIISTPQGVMTDREARKRGVGGELICEIY